MSKGEQHAIRLLGYEQLKELIAGYVQSAAGRRIILALQPQHELRAVQAQRGLYADLLALEETPHSLPGLQLEEISEVLLRVQPSDAVLDGQSLRLCCRQLLTAAEVLRFGALPAAANLPVLSALIDGLDDCPALRNELTRAIDLDGSVLDGASPRLREIRRERAETEHRLQRTLEGLVHDSSLSEVLQERFVTQRQGRYVVPVRREAQKSLPGLVHDVSSTGQTLFIEPAATLFLGNSLTTLEGEEREEVRRILAALSAGIRENLPAIRRNEAILAQLDAGSAVAHWAADYGCRLPVFSGKLRLENARHPLLLAQFRREGAGRKVVPLQLELPAGTKTLAVTGSNTGGKTVTLKTIGLIALAAQSGLPVPVGPESRFEIFDEVLADIGDEQSLADNLSTFSGHLANLSEVFQTCRNGRALVLLDELGGGTDPAEGGAIACAVLKELSRRDVLTVLTTHLSAVKNYVHATPGMLNAAVRFNAATLQPEYVLEIGRPGASHALMIARRLGLPPAVLKSAEGFLSGEELRLEELLAKMDKEQRELAANAAAAAAAKQEAEALRAQLQAQTDELRKKRRQLFNEAYAQSSALVDETRKNLEHVIRELREQAKRGAAAVSAEQTAAAITEARRALTVSQEKVAAGLRRTAAAPSLAPVAPSALKVGAKLWVERLSAHGKVQRIDPRGREVAVDVNGVVFTLKTSELFPAHADAAPEPQRQVLVRVPRYEGQTSHEINLLGLRVDDAINRLSDFLNHCALAHLEEIRVVHGFGTGRLREGIQQWLRSQPLVKSFRTGVDQRDTGGGGVTLVRLK